MNNEMTKYMERICTILEITMPDVRVAPEMLNDSLRAGIYLDLDIIALQSDVITVDILLSITHELRHKWQHVNGWNMADYKTREELDTNAYNMQEIEIDANAFAIAIISLITGVSPVFNGASENVQKTILDRAEVLKVEYQGKLMGT